MRVHLCPKRGHLRSAEVFHQSAAFQLLCVALIDVTDAEQEDSAHCPDYNQSDKNEERPRGIPRFSDDERKLKVFFARNSVHIKCKYLQMVIARCKRSKSDHWSVLVHFKVIHQSVEFVGKLNTAATFGGDTSKGQFHIVLVMLKFKAGRRLHHFSVHLQCSQLYSWRIPFFATRQWNRIQAIECGHPYACVVCRHIFKVGWR